MLPFTLCLRGIKNGWRFQNIVVEWFLRSTLGWRQVSCFIRSLVNFLTVKVEPYNGLWIYEPLEIGISKTTYTCFHENAIASTLLSGGFLQFIRHVFHPCSFSFSLALALRQHQKVEIHSGGQLDRYISNLWLARSNASGGLARWRQRLMNQGCTNTCMRIRSIQASL